MKGQKPLTLEQVKSLKYRDEVYSIDEVDNSGSAERFRVNGKVQLWKTRPNDFRVPLKYGMYGFDEIVPRNMHRFSLTPYYPEKKKKGA